MKTFWILAKGASKRPVMKTYKLADNCFFAWWILSFRTFLYQVVNALAFLCIVYKTVRAVQAAGCCETTDNIQNIENGPKIFEKSYLIQFSIKLILFPPSIEWCKFGFTIHNSCYPIWSNLKISSISEFWTHNISRKLTVECSASAFTFSTTLIDHNE